MAEPAAPCITGADGRTDRLGAFFRSIENDLKLDEAVVQQIRRIAGNMFERDGCGASSVAERIAGALLNNRLDWLPAGYTDIMKALNRLGRTWRKGIILHSLCWGVRHPPADYVRALRVEFRV